MGIENIGRKIESLRVKKGLSQKSLAEMIPISQSTLSRWEKGKVVPSIQNVNRICEILDFPAEMLLDEGKEGLEKLRLKVKKLRFFSFAVSGVLLLILVWFLIPKYMFIKEDKYIGDYGETLTVYVKPIYGFSEHEAELYGRKIAQKRGLIQNVDVVEVVFVKSSSDLTSEDNEYLTAVYFLKALSE